MSNPNQTSPRRGGRAPGRSPSGNAGALVPDQEPRPSAPRLPGIGIASEIPHGVYFGVGGSGSKVVEESGLGGGGSGVLRIVGVPSGGVAQRKRIRENDAGEVPSRTPAKDNPPPPPQKAVVPVKDQHGRFYCETCKRYFHSDRGLCGHLRTHGDRGYRGAFRPPVFDRQEFIDEGVGHLLNPLLEGGDVVAQGAALVDPAAEVAAKNAEMHEILPIERKINAQTGPNVEDQRAKGTAAEPPSGAAVKRLPGIDLNSSPPRDEQGRYI